MDKIQSTKTIKEFEEKLNINPEFFGLFQDELMQMSNQNNNITIIGDISSNSTNILIDNNKKNILIDDDNNKNKNILKDNNKKNKFDENLFKINENEIEQLVSIINLLRH